jgi:hypothetical protein
MARDLAGQLSPALVASAPVPSEGNRRAVAAASHSDEQFVASAFERILGRPPNRAELTATLEYLREQASLYGSGEKLTAFTSGPNAIIKPSGDPAQRARESLVHVLLNHNDFVTIR